MTLENNNMHQTAIDLPLMRARPRQIPPTTHSSSCRHPSANTALDPRSTLQSETGRTRSPLAAVAAPSCSLCLPLKLRFLHLFIPSAELTFPYLHCNPGYSHVTVHCVPLMPLPHEISERFISRNLIPEAIASNYLCYGKQINGCFNRELYWVL